MHSLAAVLNYAGAFFGFLGAVLWWKAASFEAPVAFKSKIHGSQYIADGSISVQVERADIDGFDRARRRPGNWNRYGGCQ